MVILNKVSFFIIMRLIIIIIGRLRITILSLSIIDIISLIFTIWVWSIKADLNIGFTPLSLLYFTIVNGLPQHLLNFFHYHKNIENIYLFFYFFFLHFLALLVYSHGWTTFFLCYKTPVWQSVKCIFLWHGLYGWEGKSCIKFFSTTTYFTYTNIIT